MRWTTISTGEMTIIANPHVRRERFLADVTTRRATVCHCCLDNVSMGTLVDMIFFTRCAKSLSCRVNHYTVFIATEVMRR